MPYNSNAELPNGVKHVLPEHAQSIYRRVYNTASKSHPEYNEERLARISWAAVKNAGYKKSEDGKWHKESYSLVFKQYGMSWQDDMLFYECMLPKSSRVISNDDIDDYQLTNGLTLTGISEAEDYYIITASLPMEQLDDYQENEYQSSLVFHELLTN